MPSNLAANTAQTLFKSADIFLTVFDPARRPHKKERPIYGLSGPLKAIFKFKTKRPEKIR